MPKVPLSTITSGYGTVDALNQNFDAIEAAFDNTLSRDGDTPNQMSANLDMNGFSILNQANPYVVDGLNWRGNWVTATSYKTGDIVQTNGIAYICIVAHTSGVFATDLAAVRWQVFVQTNLPTQTGNSGRYLSTDGSLASWQPFVVPDGSVTTAKLADGVLSADAAGRAKMADGFATTAKLADGAAVGAKLGSKIQSISATVAANAITVSASYLSLDFRSTTLTSGTVTTVAGTPANLTIASTDSFGLVTAAGNQRIAILAINNAGTIELAASALAGGVNLDETGVITTVTAATTGAQIKSATARTNVAYRVIGFVDATFTTGTGWGSLTVVQGAGGQAIAAMSSLGYGQTWQNVTGSRATGVNYYNTTGKPIYVVISTSSGSGEFLIVNGINVARTSATVSYSAVAAVVPPGGIYSLAVGPAVSQWSELR